MVRSSGEDGVMPVESPLVGDRLTGSRGRVVLAKGPTETKSGSEDHAFRG
jgi:hypothetical protein